MRLSLSINDTLLLVAPCSDTESFCVCLCVQEAARRAEQAALAEEKRRTVHEAAERHREEVKQKLEAKLARVKPRFVSDNAGGDAKHLCYLTEPSQAGQVGPHARIAAAIVNGHGVAITTQAR